MINDIAGALSQFNKMLVLEQVTKLLNENINPVDIIRELQRGMKIVGNKFESGEYYLAELMMSADLFMKAMAILEPAIESLKSNDNNVAKMVIGTPKGDMHDIGKNLFIAIAKGAGFTVYDLGVDVPVDTFVKAIEQYQPDIIAFSALLTTTFPTMKQIVDALIEKGLRKSLKIAVGGGVITENVKNYLGADVHATDAIDGINQCKAVLGLSN